jgi:hypothetical protein
LRVAANEARGGATLLPLPHVVLRNPGITVAPG